MKSHVLSSLNDGVLTIRFNRPECKNAISIAMYEQLTELLREAENSSEVRVVVWASTSEDFCSGNDLNDFLGTEPLAEDSAILRFLAALAKCKLPMVSAVDGAAVGIGATLLLHCDMNVAAEGARFSMPFCDLGLVPEAGSTLLLPQIVGHQRAYELAVFGEVLSASKMYDWGIVNRVTTSERLTVVAEEIALRLAEKPVSALRSSKQLMRSSESNLLTQIGCEATIFAKALNSPAAKEAFAAFFEKRKPDFKSID